MEKIFVSIASYRDPQLVPTIEDCLARASNPKRVVFGICWQRDPDDESLTPFRRRRGFRIIDVDWRKSKGVCWARHKIQKLIRKEDFYLQIDSHTRFVQDWDLRLLEMFSVLNDDFAVLSTYPPHFDPESDDYLRDLNPNKMIISRFHADGNACLEPKGIEGFERLTKPFPSRFVSGGFLFARSHLPGTVPYDPYFYFGGEEISYSIRCFTHGYSLFNPHQVVVWHYYTRPGSVRHWDDHKHSPRRNKSPQRLQQLLRQQDHGIDLGIYNLGSKRTLADYRDYTGVDLAAGKIHRSALEGRFPPLDLEDKEGWSLRLTEHAITLFWLNDELELPVDTLFTACIIDDQDDVGVFRRDFPEQTILDQNGQLSCEFACPENCSPRSFVIWPYSRSEGWIERPRQLLGSVNRVSQPALSPELFPPAGSESPKPFWPDIPDLKWDLPILDGK